MRELLFLQVKPGCLFFNQLTIDNVNRAKISLIIVVGGDGTIHEVLNSIGLHPITLGVIKNGSGNDFGRYFKTFEELQYLVGMDF